MEFIQGTCHRREGIDELQSLVFISLALSGFVMIGGICVLNATEQFIM